MRYGRFGSQSLCVVDLNNWPKITQKKSFPKNESGQIYISTHLKMRNVLKRMKNQFSDFWGNVDFVLKFRIFLYYGSFAPPLNVFVGGFVRHTLHRGFRPQVPAAFRLNPPSQLVLGYHWLAFLNQVLGFKNCLVRSSLLNTRFFFLAKWINKLSIKISLTKKKLCLKSSETYAKKIWMFFFLIMLN